MPCGWEGNSRSGVALAMRHRLQWFIHLRAHGLDRKISTRPTLSCGVWSIYLYHTYRGGGSVAEWLACSTQAHKDLGSIAAATLSGNSLRPGGK